MRVSPTLISSPRECHGGWVGRGFLPVVHLLPLGLLPACQLGLETCSCGLQPCPLQACLHRALSAWRWGCQPRLGGAARDGTCSSGLLCSLSSEQLISTGGVWEACDRVSCLPRGKLQAVGQSVCPLGAGLGRVLLLGGSSSLWERAGGALCQAFLSPCSLHADNQAAVALAVASCLGVVKDALEEMEQVTESPACEDMSSPALPGLKVAGQEITPNLKQQDCKT